MRPKYLICFLTFTCLIFISGRANTFIVTSNADSGPGTLREAITLANNNGSSLKDTIIFNISDQTESGRTIILLTSLPNLNSELVVDGTSQPGLPFGVSNAKIKIKHSGQPVYPYGISLINSENVEIYGLYFSDFKYGDPNSIEIRCAIYIPGAIKNIRIGSPGKGNVFYNNAIGISNRYSWGNNPGDRISDLILQSNFFGLSDDGISFLDGGWAFIIQSPKNITIGGNTEAEGNHFASNYSGPIATLQYDSVNNNGFAFIGNNKFGSDFTNTAPVRCGTLEISGVNNINADVFVTVTKNSFNNPSLFFSNNCHPMLNIHNIIGYLTITGNKIGNLTTPQACQTVGIGIWECENGIIGGINLADQNIISSNYVNGISVNNNRNITIQRNSIFCNSLGIKATSNKVVIPDVKILNENGVNFVSGTATPGCRIEVFQTPQCNGCENGEIYMGETMSDAAGNWSFSGNFSSAVTATATTASGVTGEFASPKFLETNNTKYPTCGLNNGHITGTQFISGTKYYWVKYTNGVTDTLLNQLDLFNLGPGNYKFVVEQTAYCNKSYSVNLYDQSPVLYDQNPAITNPSCGLFNGKVLNIFAGGSYNKVYWLNSARDTVSRSLDLFNAWPGDYKLFIVDTTYGCGDSTILFTLTNQSGPSLNTNTIQISSATCGNLNGSITGINSNNVTGIPFIQWLDSLNNPVGSNLDLSNIPGGKYRMKFKDQSGCDTIITPYYTVQSSGVIGIDSSQMIVLPSQCTPATGAITGLKVLGATNYQWVNSAGQTISNSLLPGNIYPGAYVLTATNSYGCEKRTDSIRIPLDPLMTFTPPLQIQSASGSCNLSNGFINVQNFPNVQNFSFRWVDSLQPGIVIGTSLNLTGINAGTFILYAKTSTGCEQKAAGVKLVNQPPPVLNESSIAIVNDICNQKKGSITGITVNNGTGTAPFNYTWTDDSYNILSNQQSISTLFAGNYRVIVKDNFGCTDTSSLILLNNTSISLPVPKYTDQYVKINTTATLSVQNPQTGTYHLFDSPVSTIPIQQNQTGIFTTASLTADKTFYVQEQLGNCTSVKTPVKVYVYDKTNVFVPSAFTPNGDGKNDVLKVITYGIVSLEYFRVYNKWGQLIFSTNNISRGWDGKLNGNFQSSSVFVWMIKVKDEVTGEYIEKKGTVTLIK